MAKVVLVALALAACGRHNFDPLTGDANTLDGMSTVDALPDEPLPPNFVVDISVGDNSTCAVIANGDLYCWGNGNSNGIGMQRAAPAKVSLGNVVDVDGNDGGRYALDGDGALYGWGPNSGGQIGTTGARVNPIEVTAATDIVELSMGEVMGCIRRPSGVECAGAGTFNGTGADSMTFVAVAGTAGALSLSSGNLHTCALTASGAARCWGGNGRGQLGNGNTTTSATPVAGPVGPYTQIATGDDFTCALTAAGSVDCWGAGTFGQLGHGMLADSPSRVTVLNLDDAVQIEAAAESACAVRATGSIVCWGQGNRGMLGDSDLGTRPMPGPVPGITDALQISSRTDVTMCARTRTNRVFCWGENDVGQCGINETNASEPQPVEVQDLP